MRRMEKIKMKRSVNRRLLIYELLNILGNPFTTFFGIVFPILMLMLITKAAAAEVPESMVPEVNTAIFISMSMLIPMAILLIGYAATYSQELEKGIPLRLKLFGLSENTVLISRMIAQLLMVTGGLIVYTIVAYVGLDMLVPKPSSAVCLILCLFFMGVVFIIFSHGVANLVRKFGPAYAITMAVYFMFMMLCGMMGIKTEQLPKILRSVSRMLPMSYVGNEFIDFWQGGSYNFMPLVQSFLFVGAVSGIILIISRRKRG